MTEEITTAWISGFWRRTEWHEFESCLGPDSVKPIDGINPQWSCVMEPLVAKQKDRLRNLTKPLN